MKCFRSPNCGPFTFAAYQNTFCANNLGRLGRYKTSCTLMVWSVSLLIWIVCSSMGELLKCAFLQV